MMKNYLEKIKKSQKKRNLFLIFSLLLIVLMIISLVIIALNVNDENALVLEITSILIAIIFGFISIYILIEKVYLLGNEIKFLKVINSSSKIKYVGKVISNNEKITLRKYKKCLVIKISSTKAENVSLYTDEDMVISLNKTYEFVTANNYILEMKEVKK